MIDLEAKLKAETRRLIDEAYRPEDLRPSEAEAQELLNASKEIFDDFALGFAIQYRRKPLFSGKLEGHGRRQLSSARIIVITLCVISVIAPIFGGMVLLQILRGVSHL